MTVNKTAITLFASTIATGLGFSLFMTALNTMSESRDARGLALVAGGALLLMGQAIFVAVSARAIRLDRRAIGISAGAFVAGMASVWIWLGPAQTAFFVAACQWGNRGACQLAVAEGGYAEDLVVGNAEFVRFECDTKRQGKYCRLAAARRLSDPRVFCPKLGLAQGYEVVEWCTPNASNRILVSRR